MTGWMCEARSANSLAQHMKRVYELEPSERQRAGNAARRRMEATFSEDRVVNAYLECLSCDLIIAPIRIN